MLPTFIKILQFKIIVFERRHLQIFKFLNFRLFVLKSEPLDNFESYVLNFRLIFTLGAPRDIEILGWSPAGLVLPHGEKMPL